MNHSPFVFKKMNKDIGLGIFCAVMMTVMLYSKMNL